MTEQIASADMRLALHDDFIGPPMEPMHALALLEEQSDASAFVNIPGKGKPVTTIGLTLYTCRWPFGDPVEPDFHYCGEPPLFDGPYCDMHNAKAYQPVRSKKTAPPIRP